MNTYILKLFLFTFLLILVTSCEISSPKNKYQVNSVDLKVSAEELNQSDKHVRILEQTLVYIFNNTQNKEKAILKYNDNQNYSMYVLPSYELMAEEPHRDILYYNENDSIFMRIEILQDNVNWNSMKETTDLQLNVISNQIRKTSLVNEFSEESAIHEVTNGSDIVSAYFINDKDIKLKLTMFTQKGSDHRDAFFQMAKTIIKETPKN
jgi:hypothetical protein